MKKILLIILCVLSLNVYADESFLLNKIKASQNFNEFKKEGVFCFTSTLKALGDKKQFQFINESGEGLEGWGIYVNEDDWHVMVNCSEGCGSESWVYMGTQNFGDESRKSFNDWYDKTNAREINNVVKFGSISQKMSFFVKDKINNK